MGDRPIQVGSHYPFADVNRALKFDRESGGDARAARHPGRHHAVRFEPGEARASVQLVEARTVSRMTRRHLHAGSTRRCSVRRPATAVRLGDTSLVIEVESDATTYGDECMFGGGKVLRDAQGQAVGRRDADALDCVIR